MSDNPNYTPFPEYDPTITYAKTPEEIIPNIHKQEIRNAVFSQRALANTQFERYDDGTFNESNSQTILSGQTIDFLCDDLNGSIIDVFPKNKQLWSTANNLVSDLVDSSYLMFVFTLNMNASNGAGELRLSMIDDPATIQPILGGNGGIENFDPGIFQFSQTTLAFLVPTGIEDLEPPLNLKFQLESIGMDTILAERRLDIIRTM